MDPPLAQGAAARIMSASGLSGVTALVLVGIIKMRDRLVRELMGLG